MEDLKCGIYQHYKGGFYQVDGIAAHSETEELMVVYVSLDGIHSPGPRKRVRPLNLFFDIVKWEDGLERPRFRYIGIEIPKGFLQLIAKEKTNG